MPNMKRDYEFIREKCASNPDAIVVLFEEYEEILAIEKARNTTLEKQNRELKERNTELEGTYSGR